MTTQRIDTNVNGAYELAYKYFHIISLVNDLELVRRDVQLLAYAIEQNKPINEIKKDFVEKFNSSMPTVGNIISKLYNKEMLVKDKRVITIHPDLLLDFEKSLAIGIMFKHGD